jgi:hypothetical protein
VQDWNHVNGIVVKGHRVAARPSNDYPYSTIEKQKPYFKERGLDLDAFFTGTLNISITPLRFELLNPEFTILDVAWTDLHPPENFSFSRCTIKFQGREHAGMVYCVLPPPGDEDPPPTKPRCDRSDDRAHSAYFLW